MSVPLTSCPATVEPVGTDLTRILPRGIDYQPVHGLRPALPPPVTAAPEDRTCRDNAAMAAVAALQPAHDEETLLAVRGRFGTGRRRGAGIAAGHGRRQAVTLKRGPRRLPGNP